MTNKTAAFVAFLVGIALSIGFLLGFLLPKSQNIQYIAAPPTQNNILNQLVAYIESDYVDSVDAQKIIDETALHMLQELDPHSYFISAEELAAMNEPLEGSFEGIGVQFNIQKDTIVIITPLSGGPSEKVGIKAGDRIITVDQDTFAGIGLTNNKVLKTLKGEKGSKVALGIKRKDQLIDFTVTRDAIPIHSIDASYMVNDTLGYIKISRFAKTTHDEFVAHSQRLLDLGMQRIIVDLRGNGGGFLDASVNIADEFLDKTNLIVYTEGRSRTRTNYWATNQLDLLEGVGVDILIDGQSASASEILAGAIQDNDRGTVIGRRSFGKGLVQEQRQWQDGSATRLTTARYYTPTGRCIQKSYEDGIEDYNEENFHRFEHGELFTADSIKFPDSLKFTTPAGKIVYGGGGIMPDVFVGLDTTNGSRLLNELIYSGILYDVAWNYVDENRDALKSKYASAEDFASQFKVNGEILETVKTDAADAGIAWNETDYNRSVTMINKRLRAFIARNLYESGGFYMIWNENDRMIEAVVQP